MVTTVIFLLSLPCLVRVPYFLYKALNIKAHTLLRLLDHHLYYTCLGVKGSDSEILCCERSFPDS
jgi:hypothetical protein